MRLGLISDIHGNLPALDAVLADLGARDVDVIANLGDIASGGLWPRETVDRLIPLGLPTVSGNHERQVLTLAREQMSRSDQYAADELTAAQKQWLAALPGQLWLSDEVLLVHGTPGSDQTYWLQSVGPEGMRDATPEEVVGRAAARPAALTACGHTHLPGRLELPDGRVVVNPGSVGWPAYADDDPYPHVVETGSPHARYAVVEVQPGRPAAGWPVELRKVAYDWDAAAQRALANDRPDLAVALVTGRMTA